MSKLMSKLRRAEPSTVAYPPNVLGWEYKRLKQGLLKGLLRGRHLGWTTALLCCLALSGGGVKAAVVILIMLYVLWNVVCRWPNVVCILQGISRAQVLKQAPLPHLFLFVVVLAGLVPFSTNVRVSLHQFLQMVVFLGVYPMMVCLKQLPPRHRRTRLVVHAILLGDVLDAVYGLYQVRTTGHMHVTGFSPHHVFFGSLLVQAILVAVALLLAADSPLRRAAYFGVVCVCAAALVCSQSRGPWVALVVSCPLVVYLSRRLVARDRAWARTCLVAAAALALALAPLYVRPLLTLFDPKWASNTERILIWKSTLHMVRDHPLAGVGEGQFAAIYNAHYISPASVERHHPHAHNSFLQVLSEDGILGLAASIYLLYGVCLSLHAALREAPSSPYVIGTVGIFCALLVTSLADYILFSGYVRCEWVFWLMLGLVYYDHLSPPCRPLQGAMPPAPGHAGQTLA